MTKIAGMINIWRDKKGLPHVGEMGDICLYKNAKQEKQCKTILRHMKGSCSSGDVSRLISMTPQTIEKRMKVLQRMGLVKKVGVRKTTGKGSNLYRRVK